MRKATIAYALLREWNLRQLEPSVVDHNQIDAGVRQMLFDEWTSQSLPIIGMLHAPPLPGSPRFQGNFSAVREAVLTDAESLINGGIQGLMLENYGDSPFYPQRVPAITIAAMTSLGCEIRRRFAVPLGINVLRNDGQGALAVAIACGACFIRVNVLNGARVADQGILQGIAHDLMRERANYDAERVRIWADVNVKHSAPLAHRALFDEVHDLIGRGGADALIVTGSATGQMVDLDTLQSVRTAAMSAPVIIGSGVSADSIGGLASMSDGMIVGSSLKRDGVVSNPVDPSRVRQLVKAATRSFRYTEPFE